VPDEIQIKRRFGRAHREAQFRKDERRDFSPTVRVILASVLTTGRGGYCAFIILSPLRWHI